jgi:hypothetical protein
VRSALRRQPASHSARDWWARKCDKCPPIEAFCELAVRLYTPKLNNLGAKSPIVSSPHMKYSRFWETRAGDRARSALRGVGRSVAPRFLRDEAAVAAACLERGRQLRRPYFIDSASKLSRKMGFPDSSATSICHSGCFSKSPATSRAMSANMPSASLRAAPSLGQSEATLRLERPPCRIRNV